MEKTRIIIDTDIGDDVDDAFAIALALVSPEIELVGVTTVYKNTTARAELALAVLEKYGRNDIPVYAGNGMPLKQEADTAEVPAQHRVIQGKQWKIQQGDAVDFIIDEVKKDPELCIVGIGAMTNLARAFERAPEIMKKSHLVLMGGAYDRVYPEWNILCDPEAAKTVLESGADVVIAGLDITARLKLGEKEREHIHNCQSEQAKFLSELMDIWYDFAGFVVLHDPLMVACLIQPEVLKLVPSKVCVELGGDATRGLTYRANDWWGTFETGPVRVATDVDVKTVTEQFLSRVFPDEKTTGIS